MVLININIQCATIFIRMKQHENTKAKNMEILRENEQFHMNFSHFRDGKIHFGGVIYGILCGSSNK